MALQTLCRKERDCLFRQAMINLIYSGCLNTTLLPDVFSINSAGIAYQIGKCLNNGKRQALLSEFTYSEESLKSQALLSELAVASFDEIRQALPDESGGNAKQRISQALLS